MIEIDLTREGQRHVDLLLAFEDRRLTLNYYQKVLVDTSTEHWTLGNDALLCLSGETDGLQTLADSPQTAFDAFCERMDSIVPYKHETRMSNALSQENLRLIWDDLLALDLIRLVDTDEDNMATPLVLEDV